MSPRARTAARPDWEALYQVAESQAGYFTSGQATDAGISTALIAHHLGAGAIRRPRRGVYRLTRFPSSDHEHLVVLWLWSDRVGVFSHETALRLHSLYKALPPVEHLTVPEAWRKRRLRVPDGLSLHHADIPPDERTCVDGLPVTTPAKTVLDLAAEDAGSVLVRRAIDDGVRRGMFKRKDVRTA